MPNDVVLAYVALVQPLAERSKYSYAETLQQLLRLKELAQKQHTDCASTFARGCVIIRNTCIEMMRYRSDIKLVPIYAPIRNVEELTYDELLDQITVVSTSLKLTNGWRESANRARVVTLDNWRRRLLWAKEAESTADPERFAWLFWSVTTRGNTADDMLCGYRLAGLPQPIGSAYV